MISRNFGCDTPPGFRLMTKISSTSGWFKHSIRTPSPTMPVAPVTMVLIFMRRPHVEYYLSTVYPAVHMAAHPADTCLKGIAQANAILTRRTPNGGGTAERARGIERIGEIGTGGFHPDSIIHRERNIEIDQRVAPQNVDRCYLEQRGIRAARIGILRGTRQFSETHRDGVARPDRR